TMQTPAAGCVIPHNLAPVVDPIELGSDGARNGDIDGIEPPVVIYEAVLTGTIIVETHNLAPVVDPNGLGLGNTGERDVYGGKAQAGSICGRCLCVCPGHEHRRPEG